MIRVRVAAILMALLAAGPAAAFDLQQGGRQAPAPNSTSSSPAAPAEKDPATNLAIAEEGKSTGAEVRIPGLGKLGVLPKLDFGLELLYGAAEQKRVEEPSDRNEEVGVRATVKHRF